MSDPSQVNLTVEDRSHHTTHAVYVRHHDLPELRGEGETAEEAARRLAARLSLSLDHAPSEWRRQGIQKAIEDVQAFVEQCHCDGPVVYGQ